MKNNKNELSEKEEKKFYDKVFGKKEQPTVSCTHRYQKASEGIDYSPSTTTGSISRNFIVLSCEKCGITTKSYF